MVLVGCGESSIHKAAEEGNIEAVKLYLTACSDIELKCTTCGGTALSHAAHRGHKEIVELLISLGVIIKAKGKHGETPLHQAALAGHRGIVEL